MHLYTFSIVLPGIKHRYIDSHCVTDTLYYQLVQGNLICNLQSLRLHVFYGGGDAWGQSLSHFRSRDLVQNCRSVKSDFIFYLRQLRPFKAKPNDYKVSCTSEPSIAIPTSVPITPPTGKMFQSFYEYQSNAVIRDHYNYTGKLTGDKYKDGLKPEAIAILLVCMLIVLENAVVLLAIWKNKKFHLPMYYLLGNLTLSDLLAGFTYMVNIVTSGANTLKMTPVQWFLREGGVYITLAASIISLLAIAIERHVTMVRMKPYQGAKRGRMFALIGASWVLSVFLGVLPVLGWNCIGHLDQCSTVLPLYAKSYILFCITVFSLVLLAIVVLYVRIFHIVKSNTKHVSAVPQSKSMSRKSQKYIALLKTVTIVLGVFIICWLPLFILLLLDFCYKAGDCEVLLKADYFLGIAMFNSLLNPIIYTLTSKDMRRAILRLLCRRCLLTQNGQVKKIGMPFLDYSTSKTEAVSHRLEGIEITVSSVNFTSSPIKNIYPRMLKT
ncbi:hypothetical protein DPEC_G00281830 [Dallia pectoralis]|uniref:Uncharacterized protein n=1 Tax=Dallia pectoralis TaxID=75939 RepID=A0ACC2FN06_DALPE|nr:hypothetical protein DPEC_G00281830 [Dallia pectoralis]